MSTPQQADTRPFDPDKGAFFFACGKKGSGKSVLMRRLWEGYPYDKCVIDPTGDVRKSLQDDGIEYINLTDPLPVRLPGPRREGEFAVYVYVPDMGSPTAIEDMDRVTGLCLQKGRMGLWVDEMGVYSRVNATPPNLRRMLHHGRHDKMTFFEACPRPIDIDPLCIAQADYVATFRLPNPRDKERVASVIGWPPQEFTDAVDGLGDHEYLWFDALADGGRGVLQHRPPLPPRRRGAPQYVPPGD